MPNGQKTKIMDNVQPVQTAEEIEQEQIALHLPKEEEVRASVISEFGFDEDLDTDKIDKAVAKQMESNKKLSDAIGQKIKHRKEAEELRAKVATPPTKLEVKDPEEEDKKIDIKLNKALEKRDLDALDYPDELKGEISRVAEIQKVLIKKALEDPYIASKVEAYERTQKTDKAAISRTNKSGYASEEELDFSSLKDFDMSTEQGRKGYDAALAKLKEQEKNQ